MPSNYRTSVKTTQLRSLRQGIQCIYKNTDTNHVFLLNRIIAWFHDHNFPYVKFHFQDFIQLSGSDILGLRQTRSVDKTQIENWEPNKATNHICVKDG